MENKKELTDFQDILVHYATAAKAREKGFYCITPHRFKNEHEVRGGWIGSNKPNPTEEDIENYLLNFEELLIAPTAGVLHQWLKNFHNISVHTEPFYSDSPKIGFIFSAYLFIDKKIRVNFVNASAKEEDAFEAGLCEALERLPSIKKS